ncbi:MAG: 2-oxoacid:acceptor oxidoreductase family protein [Candidatus Moranbacteria bacterium]|nr:2-oxoacid:acceptor oxidoreductase family protein [Candidatus Moranbacteria bacterium]
MKNKNRYEIIVYGRGGQGAKTTAEILAQAALLEGYNIQAFPEFGPERSGAPVKTFIRISKKTILTHEPIVEPDCVLVLDETLLRNQEIKKSLTGKELIMVNTKKTAKELVYNEDLKGIVKTLDASGISKEIIGTERPNTVILGRFVLVSGKIKIENVVKVFRNKYQNKIGRELTEKNISAIMAAYDL